MKFISYAQNFEDVMLWRALKHIKNGFYIDIGAGTEDVDSVTRAFYDNGWRGINVEPNPELQAKLQKCRTRDINLSKAISDQIGKSVMYFLSNHGLSTLDENIAQRHASKGHAINKQDVDITTLIKIWEKYVPEGQCVHFLKIDVEGLEEAVIKGNDWQRNRPWIVLAEAMQPMSQQECHNAWEPILIDASYNFAYMDGINRFYVANEHAELMSAFKYPPNFFDDFQLYSQQQAESRAQQAIEESNRALIFEREHVKWVENEWNGSKARIELLAADLALVQARSSHLDFELSEKLLIIDSIKQELAQEKNLSESLEMERNELNERNNEMSRELTLNREHFFALEIELAELSMMLNNTKQLWSNECDRSTQFDKESRALAAKIEELNKEVDHWWTVSDNLTKEIQILKGSISWRITWPVRLIASAPHIALQSIRLILSSIVSSTIRFVLEHPALKAWALSVLCKIPRLEAWLQNFAEEKGIIPCTRIKKITPKFDLKGSQDVPKITANAAKIFDRLQYDLQRNNKGGY